MNGIKEKAGRALHVLDRFHITSHMNQAVDEVRRASKVRGRARRKLKAKLAKKTGHGTSLGIKISLPSFLDVQIGDLGRGLSRLFVTAGYAVPLGADEEGGPDAAHP